MKRAHVVLATALLTAGPALAQDRPNLLPTRDVVVDYHIDGQRGPNQAQNLRISFAAGGKKMRVEPAGQPAYIIVDRANDHMFMVMTQQRAYMEMPFDPKRLPMIGADNTGAVTRKGSDTVAGLRCSTWESKTDRGTGDACLTDDGVLLRGGSGPGGGQMVATSVTYTALPDSAFQPPADFHRMDMPGAGRPGAPKP